MNLKFLFTITSFFIASILTAQEINLDGIYNGKNLYVLNPGVGNGFCVTEIHVNGKKTRDEINSNSFEIDFSQMDIKIGMNVHVRIFHQLNCKPVIVNQEILQHKPDISFINTKVNRKGFLCWEIQGNTGEGIFIAEQFRWGKWVKAAELKSEDTVSTNSYAIEISPNTAQNLFRILFRNAKGDVKVSKEIKYLLPGKEIMILSEKIKDRIAFTSVTMYEIIDESGNLILQGNDKYIDTSELNKGKYFINYDNKTEAFIKK
jgi:hypothetical protein